jgi:hypothetical protein
MSLATGGAGRLSPTPNAIGNAVGQMIADTGWVLGRAGRRLWTLGFLRMRA